MQHPRLVGVALVLVGAFGAYGAFTGYLAPMLAALFDPTGLAPSGFTWNQALSGAVAISHAGHIITTSPFSGIGILKGL